VDYTATEKVLPRTVPVLTLSFLLSVIVVVNRTWPLWQNLVAVVVAFVVLVGIWGVVNRLRGVPALRMPETVGPVEVGVYLFVPPVLALLVRNPRAAVMTVLLHAVQLAVIYYSTSYGVVPMTAWNVRRVLTHLDLGFRLVGRTFPILLLTVTFVLFNSSAWRTLGVTPFPRYLAILALFLGIMVLFVYQTVSADEAETSFDSPAELRALCANSPAATLPVPSESAFPLSPTLTRRERANLFLMALYGVWGYLMALMVFVIGFFVLYGLLAIPPDIVTELVHRPVVPLVTITFFDAPVALTRELLRVSGFIAVFTALYLTVHATSDQTIRNELDGSIDAQMREVLAVREVYRNAIERDRPP